MTSVKNSAEEPKPAKLGRLPAPRCEKSLARSLDKDRLLCMNERRVVSRDLKKIYISIVTLWSPR